MQVSDSILVERTVAGDPNAYSTLVERYKILAYSTAYTYVQNIEDARDLSQEAFIKAFLSIETLNNPAMFGGWLRRIVSNICKDWLKKRKIQTVPLDEEHFEQVEATHEDEIIDRIRSDQKQQVLAQAIDSLPEKYRQIIILRYFSQSSYDEMAEFLGITKSTVNIRLVRARILLRKRLAKMPEHFGEMDLEGGEDFAL